MIRLILYSFIFLLLSACNFERGRDQHPVLTEQDLESIKEKGRITVITDYSSTDYFVYKGQPLGFQYEMLQQLANHLSVRLEVRVSRNIHESYEMLRSGEADLIAQNLMVTPYGNSFVDYTTSHLRAFQVLVQRKPEDWRTMSDQKIQASLITQLKELKGKTIFVMRGSAYAERLNDLSKEELDGQLRVIEVDESMEELIYLVSVGEISYTVSDNSIAGVNMHYYPNLDIGTPLSKKVDVAWAVRKGSTTLQQEINSWMGAFIQTRRYKELYAKYFENDRSAKMVESDFYAINTGKISPYDQYIRKYSEELGWDWRLLASLIYQESNFRNNVTSIAGASGLMQLMPSTAERFGLEPAASASEQIRAGTDFIRILSQVFGDIKDPDERVKFVLAAYNIGPGHIIDARNLARKNGADPDRWDNNVALFLLSKSDPRFYKDPVVKFGYCKGKETFRYVTEVLERYEHYRNIVGK
jgi:membrane-bound lytic murein transglycosylase F